MTVSWIQISWPTDSVTWQNVRCPVYAQQWNPKWCRLQLKYLDSSSTSTFRTSVGFTTLASSIIHLIRYGNNATWPIRLKRSYYFGRFKKIWIIISQNDKIRPWRWLMNLWTWHVTRGRNSEDLVLAGGRIKFTCCLVAFLIKKIYCHNTKISRKPQVWMTSVAMWICNEIFRVWLQELKFNILTSRQLVIGKIHELSQMVVTSSQLKIVLRIFLSKFWQFTMDGAFCVNRKVAVFDSRSTWTSHSF